MPTLMLRSGETRRGWHLTVAAAFVAITIVGAAVDRSHAFVDRSASQTRLVETSSAPPTAESLIAEMMTHD